MPNLTRYYIAIWFLSLWDPKHSHWWDLLAYFKSETHVAEKLMYDEFNYINRIFVQIWF